MMNIRGAQSGIIALGGAALVIFVILLMKGSSPQPVAAPLIQAPTSTAVTATSTLPPSISFTLEKSKQGNTLIVQWENLPNGTRVLNIYRGLTGTPTSTWILWQSISIPDNELANGNASINLGSSNLNGYSFYVSAVSGSGDSSDASSTQTIVWTSTITEPTTSSTTPSSGGGNTPPPSQNPTSTNPNPATSTPQQPGSPTNPTSTGGNPSSTPSGVPYYSPQVQISGYDSGQTGSFFVQHVDQRIQIGWQNLPSSTTEVVVFRSSSQTGPWDVEFTQQTGGQTSYSIQVADDTLGQPFYYTMNANAGSATVGSYGPVYLAPQ